MGVTVVTSVPEVPLAVTSLASKSSTADEKVAVK